MRFQLRTASLLTVLAAGLAGSEGSLAGSEGPAGSSLRRPTPCLERPIVVAYLHHVQDQVMAYWIVPEDTLADQTVVVRFRLAEDGSLLTYELVSSTSQRVANTVELAMQHSGPFGQIPWDATCVVGRAIDMHFENPY